MGNTKHSNNSEYYWLAAKDEDGKPFIWGFNFKTIDDAKRALLPNTWVIDDAGNRLAEYDATGKAGA